MKDYLNHIYSSDDLLTSYEATRAGFVSFALEKNRRATPYVAEARALKEAVSLVKTPYDLLDVEGIESGLLTAAGLSEKAIKHLLPENKTEAIIKLIENFLEPAGKNFIEELIFRYLLIRGDTLGGSMRNVTGVLAQKKFTLAIVSTLSIAGIEYQVKYSKSKDWLSSDDIDIDSNIRGLLWKNASGNRCLIFNLNVPLVGNNIDMCLFNRFPSEVDDDLYLDGKSYIALGELKGGIDPAGADEHWKTARTALERIRNSFEQEKLYPHTFYIGAAIEKKMSYEIWDQLESNVLQNAANLTDEKQLLSISRWICSL